MSSDYVVKEVFYSLQGEGMRAGTPNVFVRFAGCNLRCSKEVVGFDCDTDWLGGRRVLISDLVSWARRSLLDDSFVEVDRSDVGVIFTGGEPGLQLDRELVEAFRADGWGELCVETNGTVDLGGLGLDWVTVSPKTGPDKVRQRRANEVKCVLGFGVEPPGWVKEVIEADWYLVSPAFQGLEMDRKAVEWCIWWVKKHPEWRMTLQIHKLMGIA